SSILQNYGKQTLSESDFGRYTPDVQNGNCIRIERASAHGGSAQVSLSFTVDLCRVVYIHQLSLGARTDQLRAAGRISGDGNVRNVGQNVRITEILFMDR